MELFASDHNYKAMDFSPLEESVIRSKPQKKDDVASEDKISSSDKSEHQSNIFDYYA